MSISQIARSIGDSPTLALNAKAAALQAEGEPVIHLGGGEPISKAPFDAIISAVALLNSGEIRYTPASGTPALKRAIIEFTERQYDHQVEPHQVIASSGAKQAIMVCLHAILDPGDEVIFPAPYWVSYPEMVRLAGGVPVPIRPTGDTFQPRLWDIESAMTPNTKAVMINSPNNPSGIMYSEEFTAELVEFCDSRGVYLITDDIYHGLVFDGKRAANCLAASSQPLENTKLVVVNGVSKQYAMTGFRIGWAIANSELVHIMSNIQAHQTSGPSALLQQAAVGALKGDQSGRENLRLTLANNRDVLVNRLLLIDNLKFAIPEGAFYCFPDFSAYDPSSIRLASFLLDKAKVVTVPGAGFGMDGHLRISFCGSIKQITEGIERIKWALDPNSPKELLVGNCRLVKDWE